MGKLFGTDGIRGKANESLTPEMAFNIGKVGAYCFKKENPTLSPFFVIGKDTRLSGDMLEGALVAGITAVGVDVVKAGVITTPGVAYLTKKLGALGGIMISASHNSFEDNGIKFFNAGGFKLDDGLEERMEDIYFNSIDHLPCQVGDKIGALKTFANLEEEYISYLKKTVRTSFAGLKVVLDCANGACYRLSPELFSSLGAEVEAIHINPDGRNINVNCGSVHSETVAKVVRENGADIGLAFDGDADRLIAVDEAGNIVDGDVILYLCGKHMKEQGKLKDNTIVATVMSNMGFEVAAEEAGMKLLRTKVGDRYVVEKMQLGGYNLGGEQSGHVIFSGYTTTGDGLLTALKLLEVMQLKNTSLSSLSAPVRPYPQTLENCRVKSKEGWEQNKKITAAIEEAERELRDSGRVLVRPSGTEDLIRVMVESQDEVLLHKITKYLSKTVLEELG